MYVSNRVSKILKGSVKSQWSYVPTELNPADHGTRPLEAKHVGDSKWLLGPKSYIDTFHKSECT